MNNDRRTTQSSSGPDKEAATVTLDQIGPPVLVINATDLDTGQRAAFWPQATPDSSLSNLVAASGAFPGAFDPVYLGKRAYVDGGVVENLGVEGLREYLVKNSTASTPSVLIISDLSAEPRPAVSGRPSLIAAALRADSFVYQGLQAHILDTYTRGAYNGTSSSLQGYSVPAASIWQGRSGIVRVFILRPTSQSERNRLPQADQAIASSVASIGTLLEPSPEQARAAFWLGTRVAGEYLPAICAAVRPEPCNHVDLPEHP